MFTKCIVQKVFLNKRLIEEEEEEEEEEETSTLRADNKYSIFTAV